MSNIIKNDVKIIFNEYINKKKELNSSYLKLNLNCGIFPFFINNIKYVQWKINNNKSFYEYLNEKEN